MNEYIALIGTGGTIAGQGTSETDLTDYTPGLLSLEDILADVPQAQDYGPFLYEQFSNIESSDIRENDWMALAQLVQAYVDREDVAGLVITHGTDSMEETAYFLNLVIDTDKPIVLTGSMRPAGALSADGPLHLLLALQLARTERAWGQGVLVALNGYIDGARDVTKQNTTDVATFGNPIFGHLGIIQDGQAHLYYAPTRIHTEFSNFKVSHLVRYATSHKPASATNALPSVALLTCYAGIEEALVDAVLSTKPDGLVLEGLGHGTIPKQVIEKTANLDIPVVRASRTGSGLVSTVESDKERGYLVSDSLQAQKARILLMLCLVKGYDKDQIRQAFKEY